MNQFINRIKLRTHGILRYSEKYFKTDMVYLVKGGSWLTFGQLVSAGMSFLLSIAFANLVPQTVYGTYRYVTSLAATLTAFSLSNLGTALVQSVAKGFEGVIRSAFWMNIRWSTPMMLVSVVGTIYYFVHGNNVLAVSMIIIGLFSPFLNSANLATYYANGKKDFTRLSIYGIVKSIFPALILIGTLFCTTNILVIVFVYFLSNTVVALLVYFDVLTHYKPNSVDDPGLLSYSKKLSLLNILAVITAQADKVLIFTYLGSVELAIYSVAVAFPEQIRAIFRNMNFLMVPKFAEKDSDEPQLNLRNKILKFSLVLIVLVVIYIICAPYLYHIFFPKYPGVALFSQVYALSIFGSLAWIPYSVLIAHKRDDDLLKVNTIGSIAQLILLFVFIYFWGLWGIVIAKMLTTYVNMFLYFFYVSKRYEL